MELVIWTFIKGREGERAVEVRERWKQKENTLYAEYINFRNFSS
jgi:hypothetical protein